MIILIYVFFLDWTCTHLYVVLQSVNDVVDWYTLSIYLGFRNSALKTTNEYTFYQTKPCQRKIITKLDLLCLVHPIKNKSRQIGMSLKISHGDLKNICDEGNHNADKLSNVIQIWFEQPVSTLHEFQDHFSFYKDNLTKIIFPVKNVCWCNHKNISLCFCQRIMSYQEHIDITVPIPIHRCMFKMCLKEDQYFEIPSALIQFSFFEYLENILPKRQSLNTHIHFFYLEGQRLEVDILFQTCTLKDASGRYVVLFQVNKYNMLFIMTNDIEVFKGKKVQLF